MRFLPLDIGTYLVMSRSRKGEYHIVCLLGEERGCSCEAYQFSEPFNTCVHIRTAYRLRRQGKLKMIVGVKGHVK
jgi:hypothetical protein